MYLPAALLLAQQQPVFRARAELVQVDVAVVDRDGRPVHGLTKDDFTLLDRRRPQTIELFEAFRFDAESAAAAAVAFPPTLKRDFTSNQTARSSRLIVMVIDDLHLFKNRTERAKQIGRDVIRDLGPASSMAVLFTSGDRSVEVTEETGTLVAAIDRLVGRQPYPRPLPVVNQRGGDLQIFNDNMAVLRTLKEAARTLAVGQQRRKAFVLVSEWFAKELSGLFEAMAPAGAPPEGGAAYVAGNLDAFAGVKPDLDHTEFELIDMMDALRRSNVAMYAIDPRGEVTSQGLLQECHPSFRTEDPCLAEGWGNWVRLTQRGVALAATASGGFAITNSDDFTGGLARIVQDLDQYYMLGFYPSNPDGNGYRQLEVRVNRPDVTLRYRRGYVGRANPPAPKNSDPLAELASGALPATNLPLGLSATTRPFAPGDGRAAIARGQRPPDSKTAKLSMALEVKLPRRNIARPDGTLGDSLRYTVFAVNLKSKKVAAQFTNTAQLSSAQPPTTAVGDAIAFVIPIEMFLPAGTYQLRASVTSARLERGGSVYLVVDVPDFSTAPLAVGGLLLGDAGVPRAPMAVTPIALPFTPSVSREFRPSDTLRIYFEVFARRAVAMTARLEIRDGADRLLKGTNVALTSTDRGQVDLQLPLAGMAPGPYVLRAIVTDPVNTAQRETGFIIVK